jgi:hypothetical protein
MPLVFFPLKPNAGAHLLPEAGATQERRLEAVRCSAWLGAFPGLSSPQFPIILVPSGLPALLPSGSGSVEDRGQERACGLVVETDAHERHRLDHA